MWTKYCFSVFIDHHYNGIIKKYCLNHFESFLIEEIAQSVGAVEYTDCTSVEG